MLRRKQTNIIFIIAAIFFTSVTVHAAAEMEEKNAQITGQGLSLRSEPRLNDDTWQCSLSKGTDVYVTDYQVFTADDVDFIRIKLKDPKEGCPSEGYVAKQFVNTSDEPEAANDKSDENAGRNIASLPPAEDASLLEEESISEAETNIPSALSQSENAEEEAFANIPVPQSAPRELRDVPVPMPVARPKEAEMTAPSPQVDMPLPPIKPHIPQKEVQVTASGLNVRTESGAILCSVKRGTRLMATGRHDDGQRLRVLLDGTPGCPSKEAFVYGEYVRPVDSTGVKMESIVDVDDLSLRSEPRISNRTWKCGLPKDTKIRIIGEKSFYSGKTSFVKVEILEPISGCPSTGYVAEPYLRSIDRFTFLPVVRSEGEDEAECCGKGNSKDLAIKNLDDTSKQIGKAIPDSGRDSPYITAIKKMIKKPNYKPSGVPVNRGLAQIPLLGKRGNVGPCGSHHYLPDSPIGVDAYANPLTACVFTSVLQGWKKNYCPNRSGCTIAWGDISHKRSASFNGHKTHTDGYCIDIRPMSSGAFSDSGLTYKSSRYDQDMMRKFVKLVKSKGGSNIYFNDTSLGTSYIPGHHNHIHVCFKNNSKTRNACNNLEVDPNVCPELQ